MGFDDVRFVERVFDVVPGLELAIEQRAIPRKEQRTVIGPPLPMPKGFRSALPAHRKRIRASMVLENYPTRSVYSESGKAVFFSGLQTILNFNYCHGYFITFKHV